MNLRVIKKDINFLTDEFVSDAFISINFNSDAEKIQQIIDLTNEALDVRDDIICKINHPNGEKRSYYRNLSQEMLSATDALYDKLSAIVSKKKPQKEE